MPFSFISKCVDVDIIPFFTFVVLFNIYRKFNSCEVPVYSCVFYQFFFNSLRSCNYFFLVYKSIYISNSRSCFNFNILSTDLLILSSCLIESFDTDFLDKFVKLWYI